MPPAMSIKLPRTGDSLDGRYRVGRELATGRGHVVVEAMHLLSGRPVAIKHPRPGVGTPEGARDAMLREIRALGAVRHPHVVELYDAAVTAEGVPYAVMELLEGATVDTLLGSRGGGTGGVDVATAVSLAWQCALALSAVHARRYAHGDVRGANLYVTRRATGEERLKLLDFEAARVGDGTEVVGARDDVRAVGALLAGWVSRGAVPTALAEVLDRANAPSPAGRYADGTALAAALAATGLAAPRTTLLATGSAPQRRVTPGTSAQPMAAAVVPAGPAHRVSGTSPVVPPPLRRPVSQPGVPSVGGGGNSGAPPGIGSTGYGSTGHAPSGYGAVGGGPSGRPSSPGTAFVPSPPSRAPVPRVGARSVYVTPVQMASLQGTVDGLTEDISEAGMQVTVSQALSVGDRAQVRFVLPAHDQVVTCPTVVRWSRRRPGEPPSFTVGLEFVVLQASVREAIGRYVSGTGPTPR